MNELLSLLTGRVRASTREFAALGVIYTIVGVFGLTAYVALVVALWIAVAEEAGALIGALSVAGAAVVAAIVALVYNSIRGRRRRRARKLRSRRIAASGAGAGLGALVPMMIRASPVGSLLAVAALAYVMSRAGQGGRRD